MSSGERNGRPRGDPNGIRNFVSRDGDQDESPSEFMDIELAWDEVLTAFKLYVERESHLWRHFL